MKNNVFVILIFINFIILSFAGLIVAGCHHDLMVMRRNNDSMRQSLVEMQLHQQELQKDIRLVKTDSEIVLRMVVSGEYVERKE